MFHVILRVKISWVCLVVLQCWLMLSCIWSVLYCVLLLIPSWFYHKFASNTLINPPPKKNLSIPKDNRLMESSNVNQSHRKLFITKCLEYSAVRLSWVTCNCNRMCGRLFFIYLMLSVFLTCFGREIWCLISMWYYQLGDPKICVCLNLRDHS